MDGWYPYNITKSPAFEVTCAHQFIAVSMCCFHNVALDTLVTGLITIACCQLEQLKYKIITIEDDSNAKSILTGYQGMQTSKIHESNDRAYEELGKCIEHNNVIVNFTKEIQEIFGTSIFMQFLVNCIIICLTAFHITQMKVYIPAELIGMTAYTCCMTYQIFIYCWHGNELYLQSQSVVLAAYSGNWWKYSERYKRAVRLIMIGASRPLTLTAGSLMTLSLQTFVGILRASYSFFTVLQTTTNKEK
nr:odorant receptor 6 [Sirex noctilio]